MDTSPTTMPCFTLAAANGRPSAPAYPYTPATKPAGPPSWHGGGGEGGRGGGGRGVGGRETRIEHGMAVVTTVKAMSVASSIAKHYPQAMQCNNFVFTDCMVSHIIEVMQTIHGFAHKATQQLDYSSNEGT